MGEDNLMTDIILISSETINSDGIHNLNLVIDKHEEKIGNSKKYSVYTQFCNINCQDISNISDWLKGRVSISDKNVDNAAGLSYNILMIAKINFDGRQECIMKDKVQFSAFIAEKRKKANLTQKEFANRLFVSDTAVSKWERGISYPDITLISKICEELNITEHEFINACEDTSEKEDKKQAKRYRYFIKAYQRTLLILYVLAIITCFICNIAIFHTLSWFYIVLTSIVLAFSITHLPLIVKKHKTLLTFSVATVLIYLLLFLCAVFLTKNSNWLLELGYPITTLSLFAVWLIMLLLKYIRANWLLKSGTILLLLSFIIVAVNLYIGFKIGKPTADISAYFNLTDWQLELIWNKIIFWLLSVSGIVGIIAGIFTAKVRRRENVK
ncbi:MAG: putative rane-associated regulator with a motif [Clostridia bacterium]|nr:putative rane-associated regulator with a motif [Clostridia bacterium]